jgi:hydrogenase expression/formation protein HypC
MANRQGTFKECATMCLGVPMQVKTIANDMAVCEIDGVQREASLMMIEDVQIGDYVLIHAGFAIEKIDEQEAQLTLQTLRAALDMGLAAE